MHRPPLNFALIGLNHGHGEQLAQQLIGAGARLASFYAAEPDLRADFAAKYPEARITRNEAEILDNSTLQLVISAAIPDQRAGLAIRAMQAGKDFISVKPAFTTLDQLAAVRAAQAETKRLFSIYYSERLASRAALKAGELIAQGAIGRVVQTLGLGPHRLGAAARPAWFWSRARQGGILTDIASHQMDQFLFFTGSTSAEIVSAQIRNFNHPQYPDFDDFGDVVVRSNTASGYIRVDWLSPDGLKTWGDVRTLLIGTDGYIELRKNTDLAGRPGGDHLFLVNHSGVQYMDCSKEPLRYGEQMLNDLRNQTHTVMSVEHCFLASELALRAQRLATQMIESSP